MNYLLRGIGVVAAVGVFSLLAFSLPSGDAHGDGGGNVLPRTTNKAWQQECASCHIAYSPAFLPKASWRRLMGGLDQHFGENASLDPATQADILRFLETRFRRRRGRANRSAPPPIVLPATARRNRVCSTRTRSGFRNNDPRMNRNDAHIVGGR